MTEHGVVPGQTWVSKDSGREVRVESIDGSASELGSFAHVQGQRSSNLRLRTLWDRYRLTHYSDGTPVADSEGQR